MVTKTSRTYKFSELTLTLIEQIKALPEYGGNSTRLIESLLLEKARALGLVKDNGNGARKNCGGKK